MPRSLVSVELVTESSKSSSKPAEQHDRARRAAREKWTRTAPERLRKSLENVHRRQTSLDIRGEKASSGRPPFQLGVRAGSRPGANPRQRAWQMTGCPGPVTPSIFAKH